MATTDIVSIESFKAVLKDGRVVTVNLKLSGGDILIGNKTLTQVLSEVSGNIVWEEIE